MWDFCWLLISINSLVLMLIIVIIKNLNSKELSTLSSNNCSNIFITLIKIKVVCYNGKMLGCNCTVIKLNSNDLYLKGVRQESVSTGRYDLTKVLHTSVNAACCLHNTIVCRCICPLCNNLLLLPLTLWKKI